MIKPNETSEEKFKRLGEYRVKRTLNDLRLIGNMANRSIYKYTDDQKNKIIRALSKAVDEVKHRFGNGKIKDKNDFTL